MRWWDPFGYKLERRAWANGNDEAVELIRAWRRGRIIALIGLVCSLVLVVLGLLQVSGLVGRPMPLALWLVFGIAFCIVMALNWMVWKKAQR